MEYQTEVDFDNLRKRRENFYVIFFSVLIAGSLGYLFLVPEIVPMEIDSQMEEEGSVEFTPYHGVQKVTVVEAVKVEVFGCENYLPDIEGYDLSCGINFLSWESKN